MDIETRTTEDATARAAEALNGWETASPDERARMLERAAEIDAARWEIPTPEVHPEHFEDDRLLGEFDGEDYSIHMNEQLLESDHPGAAIETWAHEYEHARQAYEISELHGSGTPELPNAERVREFEANSEDYTRPEVDEDRYFSQPVEEDAREFAAREAREILERR